MVENRKRGKKRLKNKKIRERKKLTKISKNCQEKCAKKSINPKNWARKGENCIKRHKLTEKMAEFQKN